MRSWPLLLVVFCVGVRGAIADEPKPTPKNPLVTALSFTHTYGKPASLTPDNDRALKVQLLTTFHKGPALPWDNARGFFEQATFERLAGAEKTLTLPQMAKLVEAKIPASRHDLHAKTRQHLDLLAMQFDLIEEPHRKAAAHLVTWLVAQYEVGKPLPMLVICSHNTRRSMLGATMGNLAAAYYGLPEIRVGSGGTDPRAFNPRTIATLKEIGVTIEPTGEQATQGSTQERNPRYRVQWGKGMEVLEFSKKYTDAHNPQKGFAALLVCSEADVSCPQVTGASLRLPVPYLDPKAYDDAPFEAAKYAERRDDMGRFMLSVVMQARRQLEVLGKIK